MEYCCHISTRAALYSLFSFDSSKAFTQPCDELFSTLQSVSHTLNVSSLSLLYQYFHGKCLSEIYSIVPPGQIFTLCHVYRVESSKIGNQGKNEDLFRQLLENGLRTATLWDKPSKVSFPDS